MATHYADVIIQVRVHFNDNGDDELRDQAVEAVEGMMHIDGLENHGVEVVGPVVALTAEGDGRFECGDTVVAVDCAENPPADRQRHFSGIGKINAVIGPNHADYEAGFIYHVVLDDGTGTRVWCKAEELELVKRGDD